MWESKTDNFTHPFKQTGFSQHLYTYLKKKKKKP